MTTTLRVEPMTGVEPDFHAALMEEGLPTDDLAEAGRTFFRITDGPETVGYGGFELHGEHALLRSMVIDPERRGRGLGGIAVDLLLGKARAAGACEAYLLTLSAASFFERLGFARIDRAVAPATILATRQAASLCPASAVLLHRELSA
ncbi:GNAT family N-acetyltransferase [Rhizobium sp. TH2]|uniref:arsenic resistance N-acetyltransferase ArsN2 n=1 Tax=Rhizobium sp. TH2 TaxID=2775403 RepID=UPI0021574900|nr:arsenic resistance N-acetyltransferase ArsN2 [Rhizobium sp. TH2]UVC06672.1 GNAT family N-acetyltransferase [Rhizobium sp. TH2]